MRLLIVTQYFWPENFRINDLAAELVRRGHQVTVLTGLPNYPEGDVFPRFRADPKSFARYEGVDIVRVPMTPRKKGSLRLVINYLTFAISASTVGLWKLRGKKFDAIFTYAPSPVTVGIPAAVVRAAKRAPMAFWVQDLWPETLEAVGVIRSPMILRAVGMLVASIYSRCDLILAQSHSFIPQIRKYASRNARVEYFPGWAESLFDMQHAVAASEVPEKPDTFNILFAGNIGVAQDFPAILAAAKELKDHSHIRWLIVGDGRMGEWVAEEIKSHQLEDCVLMLGRHPLERMPAFFKHAQALLVSLKDEPIFSMTIPSKLQSYLAAGIPVVAMLNGEGASVVQDSGAGLACPAGDHEGLAAAVLQLSRMPLKDREAMGARGLAVSAREFDRNTLIARLEAWFERLREGKSREAP
ncbi:glycosyltransferase family 4 protein [Cupriavidus sp. BIS7]|uniref:glycosyltransferase family 4 protein n=1 Tax=Cupriavidus sp. BIS7 TaxID=1217718 RepID=UPI000302D973|nr:glycosyltransferase family 4 protein [Cupriavidus sp. BIS7]